MTYQENNPHQTRSIPPRITIRGFLEIAMNTAVINIKTDPKVKKRAQKVAKELGFSLSSLINGYLNQLVKSKTIHFSLTEEEPSEYLIQALKESEEDRKAGRVSPSFDNAKDAIAWLNKKDRKFMNES